MSEAVIAQQEPYGVEIVAGKRYAWCRCGRSARQPFCDGAHSVTSLMPLVVTAETSKKVYLCGCKQTGNVPYCDGTHSSL